MLTSNSLSNEQIQIMSYPKGIIIQKYTLYFINCKSDLEDNLIIFNNIKKSKVAVIKHCNQTSGTDMPLNFSIVFRKTILIISHSSVNLLQPLFSTNLKLLLCISSDTKPLFDQYFKFPYKETFLNEPFQEEIVSFIKKVKIHEVSPVSSKTEQSINKNLSFLKYSIALYLLKESYFKVGERRRMKKILNNFETVEKYDESDPCETIIDSNDFIELRVVGQGSMFAAILIYHIKRKQLMIVKKPCQKNHENTKLLNRIIENHSKLNHLFLPKFYGITKEKYAVVEYINGSSLANIKNLHLTNQEKLTIIFYLITILGYLNINHFVYRDLKPDNVIVDENKSIVLVDLDRLVNLDDIEKNQQETTNDFSSCFAAPEINYGVLSYSCDIYSLGQMVYFIINEEVPQANNNNHERLFENEKFIELEKMYRNCTFLDPKKRPTFPEVINQFITNYYGQFSFNKYLKYDDSDTGYQLNITKLIFEANQNNKEAQYQLGCYYLNQDIEKGIHYLTLAAEQNEPKAQKKLGIIYLKGKYVKQNVQTAIYYFTLAANQNDCKSEYYLGKIYEEGKYIEKDINKAIKYYSLAAEQKDLISIRKLGFIYISGDQIEPDVQKSIKYFSMLTELNYYEAYYYLGLIYYKGDRIEIDINKAIYYFLLGANHDIKSAQFCLGEIYYDGKYVKQDIEKAINYFKLAAEQNDKNAQYYLGLIYYEGKFIKQDIEKSIQYFSMASKQNDSESQYYLGEIYEEGKYIEKDINKAIHYYSLAAEQNYSKAIVNIAFIYFNRNQSSNDINKAIHYFTILFNENVPEADFYLGVIYYKNENIERDINKSIYYFQSASNNNNSEAQYYLGQIFLKGKYIKKDINEAIKYFSLSANNNYCKAQYKLGMIYYDDKYIKHDIDKAISYFLSAANQNDSQAQYYLGEIYYCNRFVERNISKAINYFLLSANQNNSKAQFYLGVIYLLDLYVPKNISKALFYFQLSANNGFVLSQYNLGFLYKEGKDVTRDDKKAIHYLSLAAKQGYIPANFLLGSIYFNGYQVPRDIPKAAYYFKICADNDIPEAHFNLGVIYFFGDGIQRDINKSIYHYLKAANLNYSEALYNLALIYYEGKYVKHDINTFLHYLILSANQNNPEAQNNLGTIYYQGEFVPRDRNKAFYYFSLAAKQNHPIALFNVGLLHLKKESFQDHKEGIKLISLAFIKGEKQAAFVLGYLYHEGKYINCDIAKSIHYYKEASSFNNNYAKNNLGVIYRHGTDEIPKNIGLAIQYFEESIFQKNDIISMYNLAHLYLYEDLTNQDYIEKSIKLLINPSLIISLSVKGLLSIALVKKYGSNPDEFKKQFDKRNDINNDLKKALFHIINKEKLFQKSNFEQFYLAFSKNDLIYNCFLETCIFHKFKESQRKSEMNVKNNITAEFYEGFGIDII
ncbi:hypothetical protein M9Y10_010116 [Tritrichomonas musculus]|uniref:Protein kinase domain-containing protein n=1 Tax=Tritrichomonas musculus TaxID=1915356 RepID=A0ABR2IQH0_9EUKA